MNKEAEMHLSELPRLNKPRSTFPYNQSIKGTMDVGKLYPIEFIECNAGDTLSLDCSFIARALTQIVPVMDQSFIDVQAFAVPLRQLWTHYEEFWGENKTGHWAQPIEYQIPQIKFPEGGWKTGSLADCLGLPVYKGNNKDTVSHLPIRGYLKIWNEWYRDENLQDPAYYHEDDTTITGTNKDANWDYVTDAEKGGGLLHVCRFHDYFSSCLPNLQRGESVTIPLGTSAPVIGAKTTKTGYPTDTNLVGKEIGVYKGTSYPNLFNMDSPNTIMGDTKSIGLVTDLSNAVGATITALRQSIAIQHFYEQLAMGGGRFVEMLSTIWGVEANDAELQRSTYLGGRRFPINVDQVLQTSSTDATSPQGNTGAFSCTVRQDDLFTFSCKEPMYVYVMACIRTSRSYEQGISRKWLRKKWTDFYIPTFDGLSNMGVLNEELYFQGNGNPQDKEIFGYQECFADYRIQHDRTFGQLRADSKDSQGNSNSLNIWTYTDHYNSLPMLNAEWIQEDGENFKRTISIQEEENNQFQVEFYLKGKFVRVMPVYGLPGMSYI